MGGMGSVERRCKCPRGTPRCDCACPRGDVSWRGITRVDGQKRHGPRADTERAAKSWVARTETALARGDHPDALPRGTVLFRDWVDEWRTTRAVRKPQTRAKDESRIHVHLDPAFGRLPLRAITPMLVEQWVNDLVELGYRPKTVRHLHGLLSQILKRAVRERLIAGTPCADTALPELVEREPVFLTVAEVNALLAAHDDYWRPFPTVLVYTGLRWSEAVGLRPRYVNLARGELTVAWTWTSTFGWGSPKTKSSARTVNVPEPALRALEPLMFGRDPDEHLFAMPSGKPVHHGYRDRVWRRAVADAGLAAKAPRPHDLRHTFASLMIEAGADQKALMEMLGHTDPKTTNRYSHIYPARHKLLAAQLGVLVAGVPDTVPDGLV